MASLGIYVSMPFCRAKCSYCNFASGVFGAVRLETYVDRLLEEIRGVRQQAQNLRAELPHRADSLYFGGGTPSLLSSKQMQQILQAIDEAFSLDATAEMTLECAPGQLSAELLEALGGLGFNRVSLGVQSFVDAEARAVGRTHTRALVLAEIARLRQAGIAEISADLIAGLPGQTQESWKVSLDELIATGVPHASVYMLDVDEDSRLGREMLAGGARYGAQRIPAEQEIAAMYEIACERLDAAGIRQYEISNFARPGSESRHNLKYWTRQPYIGFGLDAHSFLNTENGEAVRLAQTDDMEAYLAGTRETSTTVSRTEAAEEAWFLGLRRNAGLALAELEEQFGAEAMARFEPVWRGCEREGLLEAVAGRVRLTGNGRLFANEVFAQFLGVLDRASDREEAFA